MPLQTGSAVGLPQGVQRSTVLEGFGVDMANLDAAPTRVQARISPAASTPSPCVLAIALAVDTPTCACYRLVHMLPIRQRERLEGFPDAAIRNERAPTSTDQKPRYGPLICTCAKLSVIMRYHVSRILHFALVTIDFLVMLPEKGRSTVGRIHLAWPPS